jgi:hypothetical protein
VIGGSEPPDNADCSLGVAGSFQEVIARLAHWHLSRFVAQALSLLRYSFFKGEGVFDVTASPHGYLLHGTKTAIKTPFRAAGSVRFECS